jgi:hypothetical protein
MTREKIVEAVQARLVQNRLSCKKAHEISADLGIPLKEIGAVCNELNIKIIVCELGCF